MGKPTLLPCPFCGGVPLLIGSVVAHAGAACLADCQVAGTSPADAAERRNRRTPNQLAAAIAARDERVRELEAEMAEEHTKRVRAEEARDVRVERLEAELAAMRPKAEAAERYADAARVLLAADGLPAILAAGINLGECRLAILAACPAPEKGGAG